MPKLNLTDEELRHIQQRRDNEKRFNLGYNQALDDVRAWAIGLIEDRDETSIRSIQEQTHFMRKKI